MGTVLWHHGARGCSHRRALLGTQGLLGVAPSGVAFLPTHEAESWGLGALWGSLSSSSESCSPSRVLEVS